MPPIHIMLKPASGLCDMRCRYCFYMDEMSNRQVASYGMMSLDTLEAIVKRTLSFAQGSCTFMFQGGEPTLAGLDFFKAALEFEKKWNVNKVQIYHALQTNGYSMNEEWAQLFAQNHFLLGVSLDGPKEIHDANRIDAAGNGTYQKVMHAIQLLKQYKVEFNILTVITQQSARSTGKIHGFFQRNGLQYQQYIPCLDALEQDKTPNPCALTAQGMEQHLKASFDLWYQKAMRGQFEYNRYFNNLMAIYDGQMPEACDMRGVCGRQFVVEADGSVYPCDFYMLDEYCLGNLVTDTFEQIEQKRKEIGFIEQSAQMKQSCQGCRWFALCRGGCRRHWQPMQQPGQDSGNLFCQAYQNFFAYADPKLRQLYRQLKQKGYL